MTTRTNGAAPCAGVEWVGGEDDKPRRDKRGWVILSAAEKCDSANPMTGRACENGYHKGYHRDASGAEWLDEE